MGIVLIYYQKLTYNMCQVSLVVKYTTALRFFATGSFQRECGDIHGLSKSSMSQCIGAVSKRYGFFLLPPQEGKQFFPLPIFLSFKFLDIVCVLLYTSIISLLVIKHVVFCGHSWHCNNKQDNLMKRKIKP